MTAKLTVIYWRDIPAQVTAKSGRTVARIELPHRFQVAIDRAAMQAGLIGSDTYLEEWHRVSRPCGDDLDNEVATESQRLIEEFSPEAVNQIAANSGHSPLPKDQNQP